jgi:hypothetical protein
VVPLDADDKEDAALTKKVAAAIQAFFDENDWPEVEQESVLRGDRDGEAILRQFPNSEGPMRVRFVEPEGVKSPSGENKILLGVEHAADDVRDVVALHVVSPSGGDPVRVPVLDEATGLRAIEHLKLNVDMAGARGWPTMWPIRRNLARAEKLLRNMSYVAALQAAIALIRKHESATKSEVESYLDAERDLLVTNNATGKDTRYRAVGPGTVIDAGPGVSYEAPVSSVNAGNNVSVLQAELRAAAARLNMPEYMFSGDASNADYASSLVAEAPAVKGFLALQGKFGRFFRRVVLNAIRHEVKFDRLPADVLTRYTIKPSYPSVVVRDQLQEAQKDQILHVARVMSTRTWRDRAGLDNETEERNLAREAKAAPAPAPTPPGMKPPAGSTDGGPGGSDMRGNPDSQARRKHGRRAWRIGHAREPGQPGDDGDAEVLVRVWHPAASAAGVAVTASDIQRVDFVLVAHAALGHPVLSLELVRWVVDPL